MPSLCAVEISDDKLVFSNVKVSVQQPSAALVGEDEIAVHGKETKDRQMRCRRVFDSFPYRRRVFQTRLMNHLPGETLSQW